MSYGDKRQVVATETFDTEIPAASFENGAGNWNTYAWVSGGHVDPAAFFSLSNLRRSAETFSNDQWVTGTVQAHGPDADAYVAVSVRQQPSAAACYIGTIGTAGDRFIQIYDNALATTDLASNTGADAPLQSGDTLTFECEGTTLRFGSNEGAGDAERLSTTDNTYTSGSWGLVSFASSGTALARFTVVTGGNLVEPSLTHGSGLFRKRLYRVAPFKPGTAK